MRQLGLALVVVLFWVGGAQARREQSYSYPFSRVWTSLVRLVRVNFESVITEKDKDSGYFLFGFIDGTKLHPGSVEVIPVKNGTIDSVRVVIQVPAMPSYVEQMLLDRLGRKLNQEYGSPPTPKPETPTTGTGPSQGQQGQGQQGQGQQGQGQQGEQDSSSARNGNEKSADTNKAERAKPEAAPPK